jgi:hypothetical protein
MESEPIGLMRAACKKTHNDWHQGCLKEVDASDRGAIEIKGPRPDLGGDFDVFDRPSNEQRKDTAESAPSMENL